MLVYFKSTFGIFFSYFNIKLGFTPTCVLIHIQYACIYMYIYIYIYIYVCVCVCVKEKEKGRRETRRDDERARGRVVKC